MPWKRRPTKTGPSGALPPPLRLGGHLALDLLNTIAAPKGIPIEWIGDGRSLVDWMVGAEMLDETTGETLVARCGELDLNLAAAEASDLREWFRDLLARVKQRGRITLQLDELSRLNALMERDAAFQRIFGGAGGSLRMLTARHWTEAGQLLVPIAAAISELLCEGDLVLVRRCENPRCTMWFYDRTKGHRRRWCSQAICGNRAKVAAFRERKRSSK